MEVRHSKIKYPKITVKTWGVLILLPHNMSIENTCSLIKKYEKWIISKYNELQKALEYSKNLKLMNRSRKELEIFTREVLNRISHEDIDVSCCRILIRKMKTKWASCSTRKTITINELAKYLPDYLVSYLIYHEVCHLLERRHNKRFWSCVEKHCPNYMELEKELFAYEVKLGLHS